MKENYLLLKNSDEKEILKIDFVGDDPYPVQIDLCYERRCQYTIKELDSIIRALVELRMDWEREYVERQT